MDLQRPVPPPPYDQLPPVPSFEVTSRDLIDGAPLGDEFAAQGENTSPHLAWSGFPPETQSFVVSCFDPDAPTPAGYWHWTVVDVDGAVTELERGAGQSDLTLPGAAFHVRADGGDHAYEGAASPARGPSAPVRVRGARARRRHPRASSRRRRRRRSRSTRCSTRSPAARSPPPTSADAAPKPRRLRTARPLTSYHRRTDFVPSAR
ncbi:YbhB/YbcL family Raf kinase inhibitor-like protein [Salana multivorans]